MSGDELAPVEEREPEAEPAPTDDEAIRKLVERLSRPHRSGGSVVERAALQAEGADLTTVLRWITDRGGEPEAPAPKRGGGGGLHGARGTGDSGTAPTPLRFILPAGALSAEPAATPTKETP